jgi:hypothetical protein
MTTIKFFKTGVMEVPISSICIWDRGKRTLAIQTQKEFREFSGEEAQNVFKQLELHRIPVTRVGRRI